MSGSYDLSMLPDDIVTRIDQVQSLTRHLQSQVDKQAGSEKGKKRPAADDGNGAPAKKGNGKGRGKNGGRKGWKQNRGGGKQRR